jgi:2-iminobutanoate/2-iminopropanoate deaminase
VSRIAITSPVLPPSVGPFSQAIRTGVGERELVYLSGQVGIDPATNRLVDGGTAVQAEQALRNIAAVLDAGGLTMADVIKANVYLIDMGEFASMNAVYAQHFVAPFPARTTVAVAALPLGARFEIEVVARASEAAAS